MNTTTLNSIIITIFGILPCICSAASSWVPEIAGGEAPGASALAAPRAEVEGHAAAGDCGER